MTKEQSETLQEWLSVAFKGAVGLIMAISLSLASWSLLRTSDHEGRIIRLETEKTGLEKSIQDLRADTNRMRQELKDEIKDLKELLLRKDKAITP